jgi:hypothetical protein
MCEVFGKHSNPEGAAGPMDDAMSSIVEKYNAFSP